MSRKTDNANAKITALFIAKAMFSLLQKNLNFEEIAKRTLLLDDNAMDFSRIRCPLCEWQPKSSTRWDCADCGHPEYFYNGCGAVWNTFVTGGKCPGCQHQWKWTMCLHCFDWALHADWYKKNGINVFGSPVGHQD